MSGVHRWFAYGLGTALGRMLFDERASSAGSEAPVRTGTEADFRADEKRFDEDEKRLDAEARKNPRT